MSTATAKSGHLKVGAKLRLQFGARIKGEPVTVVGLYDSAAPTPPTWGLDAPAQSAPPPFPGTDPPHLDEVLMSDGLMLATRQRSTWSSSARWSRTASMSRTSQPSSPPGGAEEPPQGRGVRDQLRYVHPAAGRPGVDE